MTVREAIKAAAALPRGAVNWQPRLVERREASLITFWGTRVPPEPSRFMLETILDRVRAHWDRCGALEGLPRKDLRYVPQIMFFPPGNESSWLGADPRFCDAVLAELRRSSALVKTFARTLLLRYPSSLPTFPRLLEGFGRVLGDDRGWQTVVWRERHEVYGLFGANGPTAVAQALLNGEAPEKTWEQAGLTGEAQVGGFGRAVFHQLLEVLRERLEDRADAAEVERALACLVSGDGSLRFADLTGAVADALLLPHAARMPHQATKTVLQQFLLKHLRDPRLFPARWQRVRDDARQVFLRWLVSGTLEDFFSLIGKDALLKHWEYRRAFWEAYLREDCIDAAWVVLGEDAYRLARAELRNVSMNSGRLIGVEPRKSLLLMRIDSLILAEWSHEGACRVWTSDNPDCPELYGMHYERKDIIDNPPDYSQVHYGNEHYTWQAELARYIRTKTARRVFPNEYRVKRS